MSDLKSYKIKVCEEDQQAKPCQKPWIYQVPQLEQPDLLKALAIPLDTTDDNNNYTNFLYKIKTILFDYLKENLLNVDKIFYFSDSCIEQNKNHKKFINLRHHQQDFYMDGE